jgi:hypothetical protein
VTDVGKPKGLSKFQRGIGRNRFPVFKGYSYKIKRRVKTQEQK